MITDVDAVYDSNFELFENIGGGGFIGRILQLLNISYFC